MLRNRIKIGAILGLLLAFACSMQAGEMPLPLDPNYAIPGVVTNSSTVYTIPSVAKPDYGVPFVDSTFGTRVTRIVGDGGTYFTYAGPPADIGRWGYDARQHYQKDQPWDVDGKLIAIQNSFSPGNLFLDGHTYEPRYQGYLCQYDDRWHPTLPNVRINVREDGTTLEWVDATTGTQLRNWTIPFAAEFFGNGEGNPSFDGRFAVMSNANPGDKICVIDMDPQPPYEPYPNKRIGPVYTGASASLLPGWGGSNAYQFDWASVSPSGKYVVVAYDKPKTDHLRVFDIDPNTLAISPRPTPAGSLRCIKALPCSGEAAANGWIYHLGHADMTLNPFDNNEDVIIGQLRSGTYCSQTNLDGSALHQVVMVRLKDNKVTTLTTVSNEASAHHVSTRCYDRPGWAYVGYYETSGTRFSQEVIAVKLDGSGAVERYAHHHSGEGNYRDEVHAVPSRDGRRILFASDWTKNCGTGCGTVDINGNGNNPQAYVVDTTLVGDLTHGGLVDFVDLEWFALDWLSNECVAPDWCGGADLNRGGTVDFADFGKLAREWLKSRL